jgi:hypothetical protein
MKKFRSTILTGAAICLALFALTSCTKPEKLAAVADTQQSPAPKAGAREVARNGASEVVKPGKVKYVPRESEKKFEEFLKGKGPAEIAEITDEQVYAIMGEPTRRDAPVTAQKNGQIYTVYKAYWEKPGSGIHSQIGFANGRCAGMIIGLEVTERGSKNRK